MRRRSEELVEDAGSPRRGYDPRRQNPSEAAIHGPNGGAITAAFQAC